MPLKSVISGTPGAITAILIRKSLTESPGLDASLNAMAARYMQDSRLEDGAPGNAFAQQKHLVEQYLRGDVSHDKLGEPHSDTKSEGMPSESYRLAVAKFFQGEGTKDERVGSAYAPLLQKAAKLLQEGTPKRDSTGTAYDRPVRNAPQYLQPDKQPQASVGTAYQQLIHNAPQYFQPGIPRNEFGGSAFGQLLQDPPQYFQGNMPGNGFGGNAFARVCQRWPPVLWKAWL